MTTISDLHTLKALLRAELITQSELDSNFVRDATSLYGADLDKDYESNIFTSLSQSDKCILFTLTTREEDADVSQTESDGTTYYYKTFELNLMCYGDDSDNLALKTSARFRTSSVRSSLYEKGIYISSVSNPSEVYEFTNSAVWLRTDFTVVIGVQFAVTKITDDTDFEGFSSLNIIT